RELAPHTPQRNAGQLTTGFALGQLLGPLLAALSTHFAGGLLLRRPHSLSVAAGVAATARR
ncbi:YbfB/YjiJ family MFS transporter, partial [Pseudomonas aeruginosa]|uniref:YbfB/YjiJ family MFS transporter n=1 Tax=Pseudomonas aeruginosa TaxID=287 RepID=UPI0005C6EB6A